MKAGWNLFLFVLLLQFAFLNLYRVKGEKLDTEIPVISEESKRSITDVVEEDIQNVRGAITDEEKIAAAEARIIKRNRIWRKAAHKALGGGVTGAAAGAVQVLALMWLRTAMNYQYRYGTSTSEAIRTLYKQGGIKRFYDGLSFALLQGPLSRFGATAANEGLFELFKDKKNLPKFVTTAIASIVMGFWRIMLMPIDTSKTVLQVEGKEGFKNLFKRVQKGQISVLYSGALATAASTTVSNYPWWTAYNYLNEHIPKPDTMVKELSRSAIIGFVASLISDTSSNFLRVIKTTKQSAASNRSISYYETIQIILAADGLKGLFGRGLGTRILTNGLQGILFTVLWKYFQRILDKRQEAQAKF